MICPRCSLPSTHFKILGDVMVCHSCGDFSESGGVKTDMILTRNSARVAEEQHQHEGDLIPPYVYSKSENKPIVNEDFIELYPDQATGIYTDGELALAGYADLKSERLANRGEDTDGEIHFTGDENEAIKEIIDGK